MGAPQTQALIEMFSSTLHLLCDHSVFQPGEPQPSLHRASLGQAAHPPPHILSCLLSIRLIPGFQSKSLGLNLKNTLKPAVFGNINVISFSIYNTNSLSCCPGIWDATGRILGSTFTRQETLAAGEPWNSEMECCSWLTDPVTRYDR